MRVYLSVPMIANRSIARALLIADTIRQAGHEVSSPWVLGPVEPRDNSPVNVFQRDKTGAEDCDILVADVSVPSIGVGMEIMAAYKSNRRIILVQKRGAIVSNMLHQMDGKEVVEYDDDESLRRALHAALSPRDRS
jgi:hypothetical protein